MKVKNLFYAGVDETLDQDLRMRVIASNVVFVTISCILTIILSLQAKALIAYGVPSFRSAIPLFLFAVSIAGLLLNQARYFLIARLVFFLSWTLLITAFPVWRAVTVYGYFLHPVFGIISSTMVLMMFSFRKERLIYLTFLIFSMLITVFSFEFVGLFDRDEVFRTVLNFTTRFRLHIYPFFFTIFFNLVLIYVFHINTRFFTKQQKQNTIILDQNKLLDEARLKLEQTNSQLETRVRERTIELMEQNNRLTEYAFFHAHVLRAPVSRIRGLLNLMNLPITPEEEAMVRDMLSQTMKELDETIKIMNEKLQATSVSAMEPG